jgi:hypothetical protein
MCYFVLMHGNTQVNAKLKAKKHHSFGSIQAKLVFDKMHPELAILTSEFNLVYSSVPLLSFNRQYFIFVLFLRVYLMKSNYPEIVNYYRRSGFGGLGYR